MTTRELLEMASLDAMGLLDGDEREAFDRAFVAAPPEVQAQVRREQARFARPDTILPAVEPPPGLRARVLAAIREAMVGTAADEGDSIPFQPELVSSRRVNRWWRAAALGAMAASIAFGLGMLQMRRDFSQIASRLEGNAISDTMLREFGVRFEQTLFDPSTRFVGFEPASNFQGRALLMFDSENGSGQIFVKDLPSASGEYELVIMDDSGRVANALLTIRGSDTGVTRHAVSNISADASDRLAIVLRGDRAGEAVRVLQSNSL